jgi:hypothetical protein
MHRRNGRPDAEEGGVSSLPLDQDLVFQRRWSVVQRIGQGVFLLVLLAALAGVFGTGPLAHATANAPGGTVGVDYDRFLRTTQSSSLQVSTGGGSPGGDVSLASSYVDVIDVSDVSPQPDSETTTQDRLVLSYQDHLPAQVQITLAPRTMGVHRGRVWVRGQAVSFHQVVYP